MNRIIFSLFVIFIFLTACSNNFKPPEIQISKEKYGENWPLNVSSGALTCEHPTRIILTTMDGKKYGVNGTSIHQYPSILEIVKDSEYLGVTFKMPVSFLIDEGMKLCNL